MKLYIVSFSDNSYHIVIKSKDYDSAWNKAKQYVKNNHSWYNINRIGYDMHICECDENYIIE